ncbi:MAG: TonB-dependent receptor [Bacteroidales bacterium]|nr:TonB-dependent receptor [Bacteroidales bacterium]
MKTPKLLLAVAALLMLHLPCALAQRQMEVRGRIVDSDGKALPGATVSVEGTKTGTATDADGTFLLKVPGEESVLVFESLGYKTSRMKVGKLRRFDITLEDDTQFLDESVVIGFGEQKKQDLTGSVATVKMQDVENTATLSVDQALQGRIAGADILSVSGDPTEGTSIRIRGARSITAGNEPLIVVDGVINAVQDLGDLNTSDIESISVLKDASSTAIYGSQGANGVIIVTTKAGSPTVSKPAVTATFKVGFSHLARSLDYMGADEFATYNNDRVDFARATGNGLIYPVTPGYAEKYSDPEALGAGTDWFKAITRTAPFQEYGLSVSGNSKQTNYFASLSYADDEGIILDSGTERFIGRLNLGHRFTPWLKIDYNANVLRRQNNNNKTNIGGTNVWAGAVYISPVLGIDSEINDLYNYGQGSPFNNPYITIMQSVNKRLSDSDTQTLSLTLTPVKELTIRSRNTYYKYDTHLYKYLPGTLPARRLAGTGGEVQRQDTDLLQLNTDNTVTYKADFDRVHHFDAMVGMSVYYKNSNYQSITGKGMLVDDLLWNNLNAIGDKDNYTITSSNEEVHKMSFLGRVNYNYKQRYYITFTGRTDASSNFAANNKWGFFPSAALKWNAANETWLKRTRLFQDLSLRLSAGRTGNDAIAPYSSLQRLSSSTSGYLLGDGQASFYYPSRLDSPNLTWEKTDLYNAAVDVAVLKGRIKATAEVYQAITRDLLLSVQKAQQTGYDRYTQNLGRTTNRGVEFTLDTRNMARRNFSWTSSFTISHNAQMVEDIGGETEVVAMKDQKGYMIYGYKAGYPLNSLWGFQYGGVWHNQEEIDENEITHQYVDYYAKPYKCGRPKYVDQNHDGILDSQDITYLGDADPVVYGGLQNNFHIYGFDLGVFLAYSVGGSIYNYSEFYMAGTYCSNQYRYMLDSWHTYRNPDSNFPAAGGSGSSMLPSDFMVHDASYLRLKTVSLSYLFDFSNKDTWIKSLSVGVSAENLYLWTRYNGFDPDVSSQVENQESTIRRADIGAYPRPRRIIGMVQIKF